MSAADWYWHGEGVVKFDGKTYYRGDKISSDGIPPETWAHWVEVGRVGGPVAPRPNPQERKKEAIEIINGLKNRVTELQKAQSGLEENLDKVKEELKAKEKQNASLKKQLEKALEKK